MRIFPNKKENAHVFLLVRAGDAIHKINFTWPDQNNTFIDMKIDIYMNNLAQRERFNIVLNHQS